MKEVETKFPERLIELREQNGMTRQELADVLGISRASLEYYEKGQRTPDINMLFRLSETFSISADYMLGRTKREGKTNIINEASKFTGLSVQAINQLHQNNEQAKKTAAKEIGQTEHSVEMLLSRRYTGVEYQNLFHLPQPNIDKDFLQTLNELLTRQNETFAQSLMNFRTCVLNSKHEDKAMTEFFLSQLARDIQDMIYALSSLNRGDPNGNH